MGSFSCRLGIETRYFENYCDALSLMAVEHSCFRLTFHRQVDYQITRFIAVSNPVKHEAGMGKHSSVWIYTYQVHVWQV